MKILFYFRAAWIDKCRPDILISESTYATTIRDSKRCRERDFLKKVHETVERGGKVREAKRMLSVDMRLCYFFSLLSVILGLDSCVCSGKSSRTLHPVGNVLVSLTFFPFVINYSTYKLVCNSRSFNLTGREWIWKPPYISPRVWLRKPTTTTSSSSPGPIRRFARPLYSETCLSSSISKLLIGPMQITLGQW